MKVETPTKARTLRLAEGSRRSEEVEAIGEIASEAREFVVRKYGNPPHGGCLDASKFLARKLRKLGFNPKIVHGEFFEKVRLNSWPHWWVTVNGLLVDVTADQFDDEDRPIVIVDEHMGQWGEFWRVDPQDDILSAGPRLFLRRNDDGDE
jgi:hypothetical protein